MTHTPRILLHACCGPCSSMPFVRLREAGFAVTAFFANPNIHPFDEYLRRREAMAICADALSLPVIWRDDIWDVAAWLRDIPQQTIKATRCATCCAVRLELTAQAAAEQGFTHYSTTLLYSRYQPHTDIADAGARFATKYGLTFVYQDFRTDWQQGIDMSKQMKLYRQNYCGCILSEAERRTKKHKNAHTILDYQVKNA